MKTITLKLYSFNELDKEAKEKALTTYRDLNIDFDWWDDELEDFIELCSYLGIAVNKDSIKFRGFYSQGDGSGFSAIVDIPKLLIAVANQSWKDFAPMQEFVFGIPEINRRVIALVANGLLPSEPQIICRSRQFGVVTDLGISEVIKDGKTHDNIFEELDKLEEWLRSVAEILNRHLYKSLENQYDFLTSDTAIKESILTNEYLFTADGRSANHLIELNKRTPKN
ncbi:hypothetical protein DIU31_022645 [Mucilaginibacter rubeus]|uniref:Uncharacterized protein n=2 Tax=Mucilaginibacter rubeus TaxID=2027860 RepID=A0A364WQF1_9SPHI|nr:MULTISPECIES: hypothetical protein [Mucilaginibacter]QEM06177.1 hypothetical protein DIU31_022645 [Mucilaginibacter rubeus]QEM13694.1 hypothetical protein DEO27_028000 [Mucilaginibacter rubeus]QEM18759.1 hypothetical protein DIU38_022880 [Mucilaginibacter gossypii]QTE36246.1 hypothetical protein J3L18_24415 [Mucilaginibacter gossypii]QTE44699.1 hypothetical protein J3L19_04840 [Mucilaginibacter rubeus]